MTEIMPVPRNLSFTVLPAENFAVFFIFYIQRKRRDLKPTVKKTVWWTVFREER